MGLFSNAPLGFSEAVSMLNALPQSLLAEMCEDVMAFLQYNAGFIDSESHQMTWETHFDVEMLFRCCSQELKSISKIKTKGELVLKAETCINILTYIFRLAASESLSVENFMSELKSLALFQDSTLVVLKAVWKTQGPLLCSLPKQSLSVGELINMDWTLGVSLSSSTCRSLNVPHINLQLKVAEDRGDVKTKNIEMSLPEFQNFATQLKEMSNALDTA